MITTNQPETILNNPNPTTKQNAVVTKNMDSRCAAIYILW